MRRLNAAVHTPEFEDRGGAEYAVTDNLTDLLAVLPARIAEGIRGHDKQRRARRLLVVPAEQEHQHRDDDESPTRAN